jgi:SAM-dependent methyltransferase
MQNPVGEKFYWKERIINAERLGEMYLSVFQTTKRNWSIICKLHRKICKIFVKGKVLDVGCGYGRCSEWFKDYTGIDFSPDFIEKAKQLYPDKKFEVKDAKETGYGDKEFDWAICVSMKGMIVREQGIEEWQKIEKELKRIALNVLLLEYNSPNEYTIYN